jgi:hypothetical protein
MLTRSSSGARGLAHRERSQRSLNLLLDGFAQGRQRRTWRPSSESPQIHAALHTGGAAVPDNGFRGGQKRFLQFPRAAVLPRSKSSV